MDAVEAITEAVALHAGWLREARLKGNTDTVVQHWTRRMEALAAAAQELRALRASTTRRPWANQDVSDLPAALIAQLSSQRTDPLEDRILDILRDLDGDVALNRLLIELYRRHGEVHERKALNNKAYRMASKGLIQQVEGQRGAYRLPSTPSLAD